MNKKNPFEYEANKAIASLQNIYITQLLRGFTAAKRFDLVLGFAVTEKGAEISEFGKLRFFRESDDNENSRIEVREYIDNETRMISAVYDNFIKGKEKIEPNLDWKKYAKKYVSREYKALLNKEQQEVLEKGLSWDILAFAEHVPLADIELLEDRIISYNDSLLLLAFAKDVRNANIPKLRAAFERIGNTRDETVSYVTNGDYFTEKVAIDHKRLFNNEFPAEFE